MVYIIFYITSNRTSKIFMSLLYMLFQYFFTFCHKGTLIIIVALQIRYRIIMGGIYMFFEGFFTQKFLAAIDTYVRIMFLFYMILHQLFATGFKIAIFVSAFLLFDVIFFLLVFCINIVFRFLIPILTIITIITIIIIITTIDIFSTNISIIIN